MSEAGSESANPSRRKLDEDDHDLLTFGEAGERLRMEISGAQARIAELEAAGPNAAGLPEARARLSALLEAAQRNSAQPINDENFERFFGYPGKAKRNVAPGPAKPHRDPDR
ncbi:acyl-CoA synthetase [Mycobacterium sp.]|uniref:acyl-CoA synthetase n=1 Tax=Mycobacterium sp. TaxID=1785 RepID=UPI00121E2FA2|nr:acyl-CoA synthetase [Mycobacterium sp.]TAM64524.1 MAG: acyl-CoA synthetase [Mycobacterium sp.]